MTIRISHIFCSNLIPRAEILKLKHKTILGCHHWTKHLKLVSIHSTKLVCVFGFGLCQNLYIEKELISAVWKVFLILVITSVLAHNQYDEYAHHDHYGHHVNHNHHDRHQIKTRIRL